MERPYDDIELKGATSSATGLKTTESFSSDSLEVMANGENDKRDMAPMGTLNPLPFPSPQNYSY